MVVSFLPCSRGTRSDQGGDGRRAVGAFQRLRDSIIFFDPDRRSDTVAIVSPLEGEGRTTVAIGLARALTDAGKRVVLVDADLRGPSVGARMGVSSTPGLNDVLEGRAELRDALRYVDGFDRRLTVLPAGSPSVRSAELLGSKEMESLLALLAEDRDFVVIDTPPLLHSSDTVALAGRTSGLVLVARLDQTPRDAARRSARIAQSVGGHIIGAVATGVKFASDPSTTASEYKRGFPQRRRRVSGIS